MSLFIFFWLANVYTFQDSVTLFFQLTSIHQVTSMTPMMPTSHLLVLDSLVLCLWLILQERLYLMLSENAEVLE